MKIKQCRKCKHIQLPYYHSGFTGKSGPETWWYCAKKNKPLRHIKQCDKVVE